MAAWALVQPFSLLASPPVNDAFSNRVDLQLSQPVTGTLDGATKEANEPDLLGDWRSGFHAQHPVWWNWVSTVNTSVCVVATMQQTRPVLMVWQGTDLSQQVGTLTFQNPLSQNGTNFYTTEVRFTAAAGSNYLIAVDAQEALTLMWDPNPEPNLGGYRLYIRTNGGGESIIDIGNVTSESLWDFLPDAAGFHFKVTAYDKVGRESKPSQELLADISGLNPTGEMRVALTLPPTITITAPADDSRFATGAEVALQALASDPDGSVDHVEYYMRPAMGASVDQLLGTATVAPYPMTLTNLETWRSLVSARAYDDLGSSTASEPVLI